MGDANKASGTDMLRLGGRALLLVLVAVLAVMAINCWRLGAAVPTVQPRAGMPVDAQQVAQGLAQAVRLPTIWSADDHDGQAFDALHELLRQRFAAAHAVLHQRGFGRHALLYTWPGRDPKAQPIALLAHQDVVPIAPGSQALWSHGPFSGDLADGYIWGRGSWDDKGNLMAIMEAVDALVRAGYQPPQTVYLAFGADEEVGGEDGAARMAQWFAHQHLRLRFVLDEGLLITQGMVPGISQPVALIGLAEKGYVSLQLNSHAQAGHTSMPPARGAIGVLAQAITRLEDHPMPVHWVDPSRDMLQTLAPHAHWPMRMILSNLWLTAPLVQAQLVDSPSGNAMLRSTAITTVVQGGERENVLPTQARAVVNVRLLPGDSSADALRHAREWVGDLGVEVVREAGWNEASALTPADTPSYALLAQTIRELDPEVLVAPGLLVGGTDARHYAGVSDAIFRFTPVRAQASDLARFHGNNERLGQDNYVQMIQFYERLLRNAAQLEGAPRPN